MRTTAAMLALALAACSSSEASSSSSGSACPEDAPASCPSPEPLYATDVVPALTRNCKTCHTRGGVNPSRLFDTYDQVHALRTAILTQVSSCRMPPADAGAMTTADRRALLGWVVCGAKNN